VSITVRRATEADVATMSAVMIASITELCTADHRDDPAIIVNWTVNKTIRGVRKMLTNPRARLFVAELDGEVAAVGSINDDSRIGLNYVGPRHRFRGVSTALLAALEDDMRARGVREATLESTATARGFYAARGWVEAEPPSPGRFITDYPMRKMLKTAAR
jgi:GNAT superfamily N-acetyltransferase